MQVKVQQISPGDKFLAYLIARANPSTNQFYCLGVSSGDPDINNEPHLWVGKFNGTTYSDIGGGIHYPWGIGNYTWYDCYIKFSISGSTLEGKVWKVGDPEPAGWLVTATDNDFVSGVGGIMVATYYYTYSTYGIVQAAFDDAVIVSDTHCGAQGITVGYEVYPVNRIGLISLRIPLAVVMVVGVAYVIRRRAHSHE